MAQDVDVIRRPSHPGYLWIVWYNGTIISDYIVRLAACLEFYNLNENLNEKFSALD